MAKAVLATPSIPIAQLHPDLDPDSTSISGIVTLIWPYASSTKTLSLLLVEPDFRLRPHRGQVRIHFNGAIAKAISRSILTSGDQLLLSLQGAKWTKDLSIASTPGNCIEWGLHYEERVLLQIQRPSQAPVVLDIDHLSPSPVHSLHTSTAQLSPPYNSHIATPFRKSGFQSFTVEQSWSSPAFLKRSHFLASKYDPFGGEDDFPDNDRRKRTKFGRGSGQWRFKERTPSPEKEQGPTTLSDDSTSRLPAPGTLEGGEPQPLARQHNIVGSPSNAALSPSDPLLHDKAEERRISDQDISNISPVKGKEEEPVVLNQMNEGRRTMSEDSVNDGVKAFTIQLPRSPSLERNRPEDDVHEEPSQAPEASTSPFVQSFSSSPSSFRPVDYESNPVSEEETDSLFDEPSEAEDSNGVMFSGPSSDFGLDGSVFSRPRPTSEFVLPPKEVINKLEEGVGIASGLNGPMDQESPISLQSGKPHVDEESQKPETAKGSEGKSLLRDGDDAGEPYGSSEVSNGVQWLPNVSLLSSNQGRAQETPEGYVVKPLEALKDEDQPEEVSEKAQAGVLVKEDSPSGRLEKDVLNEGETPTGDMKKVSDYDMVPCDKSTSGNNVIIDQGEEKNAKAPEVEVTATEIIDLESDDQEESVDAVYSVQRGPQEAVPIITSETAQPLEISYPETTKPLEMIASGSHQALLLELSRPLTPIEAQSNLEAGLVLELATLPAAEKDLTIHEDLEPSPEDVLRNRTPEQIQDPVALIEQSLITSVGTDFSRNGEPPLPLEETPRKQSPAAEVQSRPLSAGELPSTIADSFEDPPSKSQLLTPSTTQLSSFTSQPSFTPLQSVLDDDTLPTPRLTQGTTGDIVPPETLPLPEGLPGPEAMPPVKGTPTLIEKLKAMRRASNRSSGARPSDFSATAKWFAPKRSSGFVLDSEAESEAENSQERKEQVHVKPNTNGYSQTPDKPLAKLFIRSPRQGENFLSMNSSPQYSPHSPRPAPGFRSNFSYFVPLATLPSHFATTVDVLAIGISSTPITRSNSGTKDYNQTIYITDPSSTALHPTVTSAQIFRPNSRCFPHVEKGDALLLRDFKVQSFQKRLSLLSTESSAWATFHKGADVQILGPPVELGAEERGFARGLWDWWASLSEDARVGLQGAVPERKQYNGAPRRTKADGEDKIEVNVKKEEIEGLGVDLPGSQSKTKAPTQARSVGWEGEERSLSLDEVQESIEPPRRVLRARGVRGVAGRSTESPMKTARE